MMNIEQNPADAGQDVQVSDTRPNVPFGTGGQVKLNSSTTA